MTALILTAISLFLLGGWAIGLGRRKGKPQRLQAFTMDKDLRSTNSRMQKIGVGR